MAKCPCFKCIVFTLCKQKSIQTLVTECLILSDFLVKNTSGSNIVLKHDELMEFCEIMDITVRKKGTDHIITYNGRNLV